MMAEVGNPGSTTTGRPSQAASTMGLPGLMPTPWTRMPGRAMLSMMPKVRSPAPFEVPPERMTTSKSSRALSQAARSASSSSGITPRNSASPPLSRTAAATVVALES